MNDYHMSLFEEDGYSCKDGLIIKKICIKETILEISYLKGDVRFKSINGSRLNYLKIDYRGFRQYENMSSFEYIAIKTIIDCSIFVYKTFGFVEVAYKTYGPLLNKVGYIMNVLPYEELYQDCIRYDNGFEIYILVGQKIIWRRRVTIIKNDDDYIYEIDELIDNLIS